MYTSNQFPTATPVHPTTGTLWYLGADNRYRAMVERQPFWKLQTEKRSLVMRGFDKERFRITY
jgi:hypothetical protein